MPRLLLRTKRRDKRRGPYSPRFSLVKTKPSTLVRRASTADAGLDSPIVRLRVVPERVDSTGNHEAGLWGGGPDERVHHGLTRVQSMLGHEGVVTAAELLS